jgi:asparagine synthase (glutamine-hydrolysing)
MSGLVATRLHTTTPADDIVDRMFAAAPHRGTRLHVLTHGRTIVAACDMTDLDEASVAKHGAVAVAFCGILDNLTELRAELARRGVRPADTTEAAVVAAGWDVWGRDVALRMRGTYTVAASDGEILTCFRDHQGFRSLFYHDGLSGTFVATEVKQVAAGPELPMDPDREIVERIFYADYDDDTPTAVRGIQRLPKATWLMAGASGARLERYWYPERLVETARLSAPEVQDEFDRLMDQAVRRCLGRESSVISLSGGVDSPIVAGFAAPAHREITGKPLPALSIVAPHHPSVDESDYIQEIVAYLDIDPWHTYEQSVPAVGGLGRWVELCDGPVVTITMNEIEEHYRKARAHGYRTILTGEFAEFVVDRPDGLLVHLMRHGRMRALRDRIRLSRSRGRARLSIARELTGVVVPRSVTARRERRHERMGWVRPEWLEERRVAAGWEMRAVAPRRRWRHRQTSFFFGPGLSLEGAEVVQTLVGVRVRRPWLDVDLWEFFLSLPAEVKYPALGRKPIARSLARGRVPDRILDRRDKTVFNESMQARMDYDELERWLIGSEVALTGVDYDLLRQRLKDRQLTLPEYRWARDLAAAHAFLEIFGG